MSSFTQFSAPLDLRYYHERVWMVLTTFQYDITWLNSGVSVTVREGFITDLGSIPKAVWNIISPMEENCAQCFVLHDYLTRHPYLTYHHDSGKTTQVKINRKRVDGILEEALNVLQTTPWKVKAIMTAVNYHRISNRL